MGCHIFDCTMIDSQSAGVRISDCENLVQLLFTQAAGEARGGLRYLSSAHDAPSAGCTYAALMEDARRILGGLRAAHLPHGARIVLLLDRPQDFLPAFWGCLLGGYVPCPLAPPRGDMTQKAAQLTHLARLLDGPVLVTTPELSAELPVVRGISSLELEALRTSPPDPTNFPARRSTPAFLVLTSGSTGYSKAVVLTHGNLMASLAGKLEVQGLTPSDVTLNWISFDHVAALIECHLLPLAAGATQLHVSSQEILDDPLRFLHIISGQKVTMTFTPNFLLGQLNKALADSPPGLALELSSLRIIVCGGEAIVRRTAETFLKSLARHGLSPHCLWPAFGMTETCAGSVYSREFPDADSSPEFASLGLPVRGLKLRIVEAGTEALVAEGQAGELEVQGPMVFGRYFNDEAATHAAFTGDGWFRTGDRGFLQNGRLSLVGRSKDSIIVNGANYYSHELEAALEEIAGVEKSYVAAFPVRPAGADTEQLAVLFATAISLENEEEVHRLIVSIRNRTVLLWGFRPAVILPLSKADLPKTSLGKLQRAQLRKRLEAGEFSAREKWIAETTARQLGGYHPPQGRFEMEIARIYGELFGLDEKAISAKANFFELGGTSIDVLRLKGQITRRLHVENLPTLAILERPTIRELASHLERREHRGAGEYHPIVTLQAAGSKRPLFCVHSGLGEVLSFVNLAKYFTNERPFHTLRARGFNEGEAYFGSFPEMVDCYVRSIREKQPSGPYLLAGYSFGGAVAFEIAKVIESQGERVDFLGIFNLPPHINYYLGKLDDTMGMLHLAFMLDLMKKERADELAVPLRAKPRSEQIEYIIAAAPKRRLEELDLDVPKFSAWVDLTMGLQRLGGVYEPSGQVSSVSVFHAIPLRGTKQEWVKRVTEWDHFTREANRYIDVPGEHHTMMGPQYVGALQAALHKELEFAEARAQQIATHSGRP
jgi:acyl-CoA synthetase (AMP-forming)/AMP-acid ligase II/thioesterase domain-containing protein